MKKIDYDAFIKAVDVVCINCIDAGDDRCKRCAVRKTVDYLKKQNK